MKRPALIALAATVFPLAAFANGDLFESVEHHYVDNDGVKIHYVSIGEGPTILFIHGFPNWWYDWRNQMEALSDSYRCVAMDTRGYNKSDNPQDVADFEIEILLSDVDAVISDLGVDDVTLVGHDWGGGISWRYAMHHPERVNKLVIFNLTHPNGYMAVRNNPTPEQKANMEYIRRFQNPEASKMFNGKALAMRYQDDPVVQQRYEEAYEKSSFNSMLNYYRALWPRLESGEFGENPQLTMPVLQFHGLNDRAVDKDGLRDTWNWIDQDYTLVTIPKIGHDPHHDAAELVNTTLRAWLAARP